MTQINRYTHEAHRNPNLAHYLVMSICHERSFRFIVHLFTGNNINFPCKDGTFVLLRNNKVDPVPFATVTGQPADAIQGHIADGSRNKDSKAN